MDSLILALRLLLGGVFATAGVAKLRDLPGSRRAVEDFGLPAPAARWAGVLLPVAELAVAASLLIPASARWGAVAAAILLGVFVVAIALALRQGRAPDCHCFGQLHSEPVGRGTLARNAVLIAASIVVVANGPGPAVHTWFLDRSALELAALSLGLVAAGLATRELRKWNRRRRKAAAIRAGFQAKYGSSGPPLGSPAPEFALRDMRGTVHTLESLCALGRPVLLVFLHPECGPCRTLLPKLGRWRIRLAGQLTIAVLTQGGVSANQPLQEESGIEHLLLQEGSEVYQAYELRQGTPSGVVVSPDVRIASVAAAGDFAIEELIRLTLRRAESEAQPGLAA